MPQENDEKLWSRVDRYLNDALVEGDPVQEATLATNAAAGLPAIDVSPTQGKFLNLLARIHGAKRILEIGTLGGYSTIWLARALPADGKLITLESQRKHAQVAGENIARAGFSDRVEIRVGAAGDSLAELDAEDPAPFDMIFIDADKPNNPVYLEWAIRFARKGGIIVVDNVIRDGEIANAGSTDPSVVGTRTMFAMISGDKRLDTTALQTVGGKGYDGFALAVVL